MNNVLRDGNIHLGRKSMELSARAGRGKVAHTLNSG